MKIMGIDPSYVGNLDLNVYSSSSPGLNGSLVPFVKTKDLYFNDDFEPQEQLFEIAEEERKLSEEQGNLVVKIGDGTAASYYDAINKAMHRFRDHCRVSHEYDEGVLRVKFEGEDEEYEIL